MAARIHIIQCIENEIETREPLQVELLVLDVGMICDELDVRIEPLSHLFRDEGFRLLDVLMSEQELAVEVAQVDRVKVNNVDFAKAGENEVLEQLAANATSANQ
jgi:hypothetical protein